MGPALHALRPWHGQLGDLGRVRESRDALGSQSVLHLVSASDLLGQGDRREVTGLRPQSLYVRGGVGPGLAFQCRNQNRNRVGHP